MGGIKKVFYHLVTTWALFLHVILCVLKHVYMCLMFHLVRNGLFSGSTCSQKNLSKKSEAKKLAGTLSIFENLVFVRFSKVRLLGH